MLALICFLLAPFSTAWRGYALSILWRWFIVSTFGVIQISVPQAIGIMACLSFMTDRGPSGKKDDKAESEKIAELIAYAALMPLFMLGFGAIVKMFL